MKNPSIFEAPFYARRIDFVNEQKELAFSLEKKVKFPQNMGNLNCKEAT
jgi:hypothetical protein